MVDKRPARNLDPRSEPWGRSVDNVLDQLIRSTDKNAQDNFNSFKGLNSTMGAIAQQIVELNKVTQTLVQQQAELVSTQNTLAAAQATLSEQQSALSQAFSQISTVSANQVTGASASNSNGAPIGVSSGGNYLSAGVVVPAGYSRAVVTATSSVRVSGSGNMAMYLSVNINGNVGNTFPVFPEGAGSVTTAASAGHAATLTGLSGGQIINVWGRTTSVSGVSGAYFSNVASFIFLK